MKAVVAAFNQEKALVGAFSVITKLRMELFQALVTSITLCYCHLVHEGGVEWQRQGGHRKLGLEGQLQGEVERVLGRH